MKILALERELDAPHPANYPSLLKAEASRVWEMYQAGWLREIYFDAERHTAVLMLECTTLAAAKTCLESLPLVQAKLIRFELIPLGPYSGFARLFEASSHQDESQ